MTANRQDTNETRLALLEKTCSHIYETLEKMDRRFDSMDKKIDSGFDRIEKKIDRLDDRMWRNFYWYVGGFAAMLGILAKVAHWI